MNVRHLIAVVVAAATVAGCGAQKPELSKEDQTRMDKLFREGIKPSQNPGASPTTGGDGKPMNQDAG